MREGRKRGPEPIYAETCPQYLALDDSSYQGRDGVQYLVAPPLRKPHDRSVLIQALAAGEIDVVATDHCPFQRIQKDRPGVSFTELPNGLPGIETRLPILRVVMRAAQHSIGAGPDHLDMEDIVRLASRTPARIFGLYPRKGVIEVGSDADLVLFDPDAEWTIAADALHMATDFSPYEGLGVKGRVRTVLLRGAVALDGGLLLGERLGRYLPRPGASPARPGAVH